MQLASLSRLFDATGGLIWHARALRSRRSLWRPFLDEVSSFLDQAPPGHQNLVLVGPSAGWCLSDKFLQNFGSITCIDPDPLAPILFNFVHGAALRRSRAKLIWIDADFFADPLLYLGQAEDQLVLFCNVAGQLFLNSQSQVEVEARLASIPNILSGYNWGSFHDLLSAPIQQALPARRLSSKLDGERVISDYGQGGTWLDHWTANFLPAEVPRVIIPWQLKPKRLHLVEAGWVS
jgi:hypothetical protein